MAYNYFGQATPQAIGNQMMMPTQDDSALALGAPQQAPVASKMPSMTPDNLQQMAKMMKGQGSGVPDYVQAQGVPANAQSYNTGAGPLPWLQENTLPWQKTLPWLGGGNG